jgi:hypothetical protein
MSTGLVFECLNPERLAALAACWLDITGVRAVRQTFRQPQSKATCNQQKLSSVMPAKAGIQQGFAETQDSRLRGNDKLVESDS